MTIEPLLADITKWARSCEQVAGVALVGSFARGTSGMNSDIDLVIVSSNPDVLVTDSRWIAQFGKPASIRKEQYGLVTSLRATYGGRREIEFAVTSLDWCTPPIDPDTAKVIAHGLRPLYDPHNLLQQAVKEVSGRGTEA